jgi:superfamily I DNA/RNA helicase
MLPVYQCLSKYLVLALTCTHCYEHSHICYYSVSRTVHQAKGREWDRVKLGNDFDELLTSTAEKLQKELKENCTCSKIKQQKQQKASSTRGPHKSAAAQQHPVPSTSATTTQSQSVQFTASSQLAAEKCNMCKELLELKDLPVDHWRHHTPSELREQAACVLFVALTRAKRELKLNSVVDDFLQWVNKRDADTENNNEQAHILPQHLYIKVKQHLQQVTQHINNNNNNNDNQ